MWSSSHVLSVKLTPVTYPGSQQEIVVPRLASVFNSATYSTASDLG